MGKDHSGNLRVLCIDRDPDVGAVIELALGLDPFIDTVVVHDVEIAKAHLCRSGLFDLVLLDALTLVTHGQDLRGEIRWRERAIETPVVILSADPKEDRFRDIPGIVGIIRKPFDPLRLADEIRELLCKTDMFSP